MNRLMRIPSMAMLLLCMVISIGHINGQIQQWNSYISSTTLRTIGAFTNTGMLTSDAQILSLCNWFIDSSELSSWYAIGNYTQIVTSYNWTNFMLTNYIFSGHNGSYYTTYPSLKPHSSVYMLISFFMTDIWTPSDIINIIIFNNIAEPIVFSNVISMNYSADSTTSTMGYPSVIIRMQFPHNESDLHLIIQHSVKSAHYGFRDIQVLFSNNSVDSAYMCGIAASTTSLNSTKCPDIDSSFFMGYQLPNLPGSYYQCDSNCQTCFGPSEFDCNSCSLEGVYNGSACQSCDSTCSYCYGTSRFECLTCITGRFKNDSRCDLCPVANCSYCDLVGCYTCDVGFYLHNSTSCLTCDPSCQTCNGPYSNNCTTCGNIPHFYLDSVNHTCNPCPYPCTQCYGALTSNCYGCAPGYIYDTTIGCYKCDDTCKSCLGPSKFQCVTCNNSLIFSWNHTCMNCTAPYKIVSGVCNLPCQNNSYYYPHNETCSPSCPQPFIINSTSYYTTCNLPCNSTAEYLYNNQTCIDSCNPPLKSNQSNGINLCQDPCQNSSLFYYTETDTCKENCTHYTSIHETKLCIIDVINITNSTNTTKSDIPPVPVPIVQDDPPPTKAEALGNTASTIANAGLMLSAISSPGDPSMVIFSAISKMLLYTRYLQISHSPKLEGMFQANRSSGLPISSLQMSTKMMQKFPNVSLPYQFAHYKMNPNFVVNFWNDFVFLVLIFLVLITIIMIEYSIKRFVEKSIVRDTAQIVKVTAQGFFLVNYYSNIDNIVLYSVIQYKATELSSLYSCLSLVTSVLFLIFCITVMVYHSRFLYKRRLVRLQAAQNQTPERLEAFDAQYKGIQVFYKNFKDATFVHEAFLLLQTVRAIIFNLIITTLYMYPLTSISLIVVLNVAMLTYICAARPFKLFINLVQQLTVEAILLTANVALLVQAIFDVQGESFANSPQITSQVVEMMNLIFKFIPNVFLVAKVAIVIYKIIKNRRLKKISQTAQLNTSTNPMNITNVASNSSEYTQNNTSAQGHMMTPMAHYNEQSILQSINEDLNAPRTEIVGNALGNRRLPRIRKPNRNRRNTETANDIAEIDLSATQEVTGTTQDDISGVNMTTEAEECRRTNPNLAMLKYKKDGSPYEDVSQRLQAFRQKTKIEAERRNDELLRNQSNKEEQTNSDTNNSMLNNFLNLRRNRAPTNEVDVGQTNMDRKRKKESESISAQIQYQDLFFGYN